MNTVKCIVGLGNPGDKHSDDRHNVGFWLVDRVANIYKERFQFEKKFNAEISKIETENGFLWLLKPMTYMNESGRAVRDFLKFYKFSLSEILVAHDDLDVEAGIIKLKLGGGHGGHNGLRSIINLINDKNFHRVRIGIGHPGQKSDVSDFVLSKPKKIEKERIDASLDAFENNLYKIQLGDFEGAMRDLHSREN